MNKVEVVVIDFIVKTFTKHCVYMNTDAFIVVYKLLIGQ